MFKFKIIDLQKLPISKILVGGLLIALVFSIRSCNLKDLEISQTGLKVQMYENKNQVFTKTINKLGQEVSTQKELVLNKDKELEKALLLNSNLKSLSQQVTLVTKTEMTNVSAHYDSSISKKQIDSSHSVPIGTTFKKENKWFFINGFLSDTGAVFTRIGFNDSTIINYGLAKQSAFLGFIKPKEHVIEVINLNPYSKTSGMKNVTLKEDKAWYQTNLFKFGSGIFIGFLITKL